MTHVDRCLELWAIFVRSGWWDRGVPNIGQFTVAERRRLEWGVRQGMIRKVRQPWPGPDVGTCIKTWYVRQESHR